MAKFADIEIDPGIIRRAAAGDAKAHEIIYRAFSTPVYSICLRFTKALRLVRRKHRFLKPMYHMLATPDTIATPSVSNLT